MAIFALSALAASWLCPSVVSAAVSPWAETEQTAVRLVTATEAVGAAKTVSLGLHFRLREGWKIYWRSPGDAGYPPRVDWSGSENLASATLSWPAPERFSILGFETLGYTGEVVLPVTATLARAGEPLVVRAAVEYLTCKEICIPYDATLALRLPAGAAEPSPFAHLINRFAVHVPGDGSATGVAIETAEVVDRGAATVLWVTASATMPFVAPDLYVEGPDDVVFSAPRVSLSDGGKGALLEVPVDGAPETGLAGARLTMTLVDGARSAERTLAVVAAGGGPRAVAEAPVSVLVILALAVLGGLILNLMPCVLPVLSIKLLGVVGHGGGAGRAVSHSFIASAAGIVVSFLLLAAALVWVKAAGMAVGWGIQFQHPWFLIAMTLVVALFACNLWGFFDVGLPRWLADVGGGASRVRGLAGHFLSGGFATLLATPCSAPFLGTAVGFALSRGPAEIFAIFAALGVGLALPYLAVAAAPGLATRLPRPGPWMATLRRVLGFALAATGVWLLTVLAAQVGPAAAAAVGVLVAGAGAALFVRRRARAAGRRAGAAATAVLAGLAFLVPAVPPAGTPAPAAATEALPRDLWQPFDEDAIPELVAAGKTVFVDVTADWCITCQINKSFVILKGDVIKRLTSGAVVPMQADWTLPDEGISRYLALFGRYGIPFDAVYGPGAPDGIALPELLTEGAVLAALDRAAGPAR
ncbi:MAG: protein-disulfide reductase DsbD family protein [Rhodospirillales bacterium]